MISWSAESDIYRHCLFAFFKVVILFTDGFDDSIESLKASAESLRQSGMTTQIID